MLDKEILAILLGALVYREREYYRSGVYGDCPIDDYLDKAAHSINEFFLMERASETMDEQENDL